MALQELTSLCSSELHDFLPSFSFFHPVCRGLANCFTLCPLLHIPRPRMIGIQCKKKSHLPASSLYQSKQNTELQLTRTSQKKLSQSCNQLPLLSLDQFPSSRAQYNRPSCICLRHHVVCTTNSAIASDRPVPNLNQRKQSFCKDYFLPFALSSFSRKFTDSTPHSNSSTMPALFAINTSWLI